MWKDSAPGWAFRVRKGNVSTEAAEAAAGDSR